MSDTDLRELAVRFKAMETIKAPQASRRKKQRFQYLIVLDFEATCWSTKIYKHQNNEIIEFAAVLLNVETGKIENEFQEYCKPTENARLSDFCVELTGIQQKTVDNAEIVSEVLSKFHRWLKMMEKLHRFVCQPRRSAGNANMGLATFATWTDWDLGTCLRKECVRKRIPRETYYNHWIDVRKTYANFYKFTPMGLRGALNSASLEFVGTEHCGLDDAKNTAFLINDMIRDGTVMEITKYI